MLLTLSLKHVSSRSDLVCVQVVYPIPMVIDYMLLRVLCLRLPWILCVSMVVLGMRS